MLKVVLRIKKKSIIIFSKLSLILINISFYSLQKISLVHKTKKNFKSHKQLRLLTLNLSSSTNFAHSKLPANSPKFMMVA